MGKITYVWIGFKTPQQIGNTDETRLAKRGSLLELADGHIRIDKTILSALDTKFHK